MTKKHSPIDSDRLTMEALDDEDAGRVISLDTAKFTQLMAMLEAPPVRNPGLERLMSVKAPWNHG